MASFFNYVYRTSDSTGIDIKYFIVRASNGDIKTAFDACESCWSKYKGYAQVGTQMMCRNCTNKYPVDGLGTQGTGGCWPGYLPHTIVGDSIHFTQAALYAGHSFFKTVSMFSVGTQTFDLNKYFKLQQTPDLITVIMPVATKRKDY